MNRAASSRLTFHRLLPLLALGLVASMAWTQSDAPLDPQGDDEAAPWVPGVLPKRDKDGFPVIAAGEHIDFFAGDKAYFVAPAGTMKVLAQALELRLATNDQVPRPVIDTTGLEGKYDLKLSWSPRAESSDVAEGPSLLSALESQLGLKLLPKKSAPVEILVIDHLERTPRRIKALGA